MANDVLRVILQLDSTQYKREAKEAASATGQITQGAQQAGSATGAMSGQMTGATGVAKGMGSGFSAAGTLIKTGFAVVAASSILEVVKGMDALNMKAEAVERRFNTVFGNITDEARDWAEDQKTAFGVSQTGMEDLMAKAQDLLVPLGFDRDAAFALSQEILTTANALSEWSGGTKTAAEAQDIATKAILGERDGLVELGVKISDADVKAQLLKTGQDKLTGAALAQATATSTLTLMQEKSSDALAAYEDRAGTAAEKQKELNAAVAESAETWARIFKPVIDDAKTSMGDMAFVAGYLSEQIAGIEGPAGDLAATAGGLLGPFGLLSTTWGAAAGKLREIIAAEDDQKLMQEQSVQAGENYLSWLNNQARAQEAVGEATALTTAEIKTQMNTVRAGIDPLFAVVTAQQKVTDAQQEVTDASVEFGKKSPQHQQALQDLVLAQIEYNGAVDIAKTSAPGWQEELRNTARELGLNEDEVAFLVGSIEDDLNGVSLYTPEQMAQIRAMRQDVVDAYDVINAGPAGRRHLIPDTRVGFKAGGGRFRAGDVDVVGEHGIEVVKWGADGTVIPNHMLILPNDGGRVLPPAAAPGPGRGQSLHVTIAYPQHTGDDILAGVQRAVGLAGLVHFAEVTSGES